MHNSSPIKVLVVDDSSLMRSHICAALIEHGMLTDTANNGAECLEKIKRFQPDVVTLDINMPVMDGIECLAKIMQHYPLPVVMVSSLTQKNAGETLTALDMGAVDYVAKPHGPISLTLNRSKYMLISKVMNASKVKVKRRIPLACNLSAPKVPCGNSHITPPRSSQLPSASAYDAVVIGVSTGGPSSLQEIIPKLPANFPFPIVVAQHMPSRFTQVFASRLNEMSALVVEELTQATQLKPGYVYIAQGDANIEMFSQSGRLCARPNSDISDSIWRPSITKLVESALSVMLPKKICFVQLTGMGNDGAHAMARAYQLGATTIAESEQTATVYGMPKELVKLGGASMVLPNYDIANALLALK